MESDGVWEWEKAEMPDAFYEEQAVFFDAVSRSL